MTEKTKFKPLWRIHNRTYRQYAKGITRKRFSRYWSKIRSRLKFAGTQRQEK